jgi:hypothetical protein
MSSYVTPPMNSRRFGRGHKIAPAVHSFPNESFNEMQYFPPAGYS